MIFVTVGTRPLGFDRLIKKIDEISGEIDEEVIAQIGSTAYQPKNLEYFTYKKDEKKILKLYKESRIVISHSGAGTILNLLDLGKPIILVPRLKKYDEIIDDHQLELAEVLQKQGKAIVVYDIEKLENAIQQIKPLKIVKRKESNKLVEFLKEYIRTMEHENLHGNINTLSS